MRDPRLNFDATPIAGHIQGYCWALYVGKLANLDATVQMAKVVAAMQHLAIMRSDEASHGGHCLNTPLSFCSCGAGIEQKCATILGNAPK